MLIGAHWEASLLFRTMAESDLDLILTCLSEPSVNTTTEARFREHLAARSYRPEWTWLAFDGDALAGLAVWWGFPAGDRPLALDALWAAPAVADPVPLWAGLIRQVPPPVEYHIFTTPDSRDDPGIDLRLRAAAEAGLKNLNERFRYEWTSASPLPERSTRLAFAPATDEEFADAFERISAGSLDVAMRAGVARQGARAQALADLEDYKMMPGPREWWRLAHDSERNLVGAALPSANAGGPVVGYVGVVPEQRGHGYAADLLAEITWMLAAEGATVIRADTDSTNTPMVATFERQGYRRFALRLVAC
ncbi:GNAT family N-acetyltransferase [Paractinoplanes brasiliensis]|uniref:Acetyltransferase (GNAT) family protein n=1 Tax=Paractinoplanes brasiliensis TaxID=52695 RepID=A0A4R6JA64_9ACTN|nr:GNAT family N-acetyltransferase [Actinoplanes brasiliensis]TDO32137.1 acetyltransferase (GNAT) family protein [Actinoplanes brasiliensis]GID28190.1 N-acetyltransferase [Actinoplanes brasiliensis]